MSRRIYIFFLFISPLLASAQVVSNGGRFQVDYDLGCTPFTVNVTPLDAFGAITRQYFYEDGAVETTSTTYTYTSAGTYEIIQVVGIDVIPKTDTLVIQVIDPTETQFTVEKCNLNGITVTSTEDVYDFIRVYFTPTDSVTLNLGEVASFNYSSSSTQTFETKGFYNTGTENCTTFSHMIDAVNILTTPTVLSASVSETCRDYFVLELQLQDVDPQIDYQVEFEQATTSVIYEGAITSSTLIVENINYSNAEAEFCVKVNAIDNCTSSIMEGAQFCASISELSATPFENLYSTYVSNGITINLDPVSTGSLQIYRKLGADGEFELRTTVQDSFTDQLGLLSRQYFYRVDYLDSCNEVLYSMETNPPLLSSQSVGENAYSIEFIDAVNQLGNVADMTYEVGNASVDTQPITSSTFNMNLNPLNGTRQFLQATVSYSEGTSILSNQLVYKYVPFIHVPTVFTPNGDGLNDTLELFGLPTEVATTNIYTKWGQLIYSSIVPAPGWDGTINGSLAPEGAYLYEIIFEDSDGVQVIQKGTFALIKK